MKSRAPVRGRVVVGAVVVGAMSLAGVALALTRPHTIVYRALATDCHARVEYSSEDGRVETTMQGELELGPFEISHGEVANLLVFAERDCLTSVRCEIVEDGVSVAVGQGRFGAMCSAATAR